jgi:hypothetical protein
MGDYLAEIEYSESERSEDPDNPSEYSLTEKQDLDELDGMLNEREQNKQKYDSLIDDKYQTIKQFNSGNMDTDIYFATIANINRELELIELEDLDIEQALINKEIEFKIMLDEYENKIKNAHKGGVLNNQDIQKAEALRFLIKELQAKYLEIEEENEPIEPLEPNSFDAVWDSMDFFEQREIQNLVDSYNKSSVNKIEFPVQQNYKSLDDYLQAKNDFYESVAMFLPGYFNFYLSQEKDEIDKIAKKLGIPKPSKNTDNYENKIEQFYTDMVQLLPVYNYKMKIRSIGIERELIPTNTIGEYLKNELENLREEPEQLEVLKGLHRDYYKKKLDELKIIPITLNEEEQRYTEKNKVLKLILNKLDREFLTECIYLSNPKLKVVQKESEKPIINKSLRLKEMRKETDIKELTPEEKVNYALITQRRQLLTELLEQYKKFELKKAFKKIKEIEPTQEPEKIIVNDSIRKNSKGRLTVSFEKDLPSEFNNNVDETVNKLELYTYNITRGVLINYINKIEDILFVLDNYSNFKQKILNGQINPLQIVLFEKEISDEARIHVFPVKVQVRKKNINLIKNQLQLCKNLRGSRILVNIIIKNLSRRLELLLFNLSSNESNYLYNLKKLIEILNYRCNDIVSGKLTNEMIISLISTGQIQTKIDYPSLSLKEIEALIGQENEKLNSLNELLRKYNAKDFFGEFIYLWEVPSTVSKEDLAQWNYIKQNLTRSMKGQRPYTRKVSNEITENILKLNNLKFRLDKKYNLTENKKIYRISREIEFTENKLKMLSKIQFEKVSAQIDNYKRRYISYLKNKYSNLELPSLPNKPKLFSDINKSLIKEVAQAYKRKLITDTVSDQTKKNKLISLLELYDLNELNGNTIIDKLPVLDKTVYNLIKRKLEVYINEYTPASNISTYYKRALNELLTFFGLSTDLPTLTDKLDSLVANWPREYHPSPFTDFYGQDTFSILLESTEPIMFYDTKINNNFLKIIKENTPPGKSVFRKPAVLFDETTGKFGENSAPTGKLFFIEYLDKDFSNGQPFNQYKTEMERDPRTGLFIPVNRITQKRGKFPFILRELGTKNVNETFKVWTEVPLGSIKYYSLNYDSCSRFKDLESCNAGRGLGNKECMYDTKLKVCKSKFGKKK